MNNLNRIKFLIKNKFAEYSSMKKNYLKECINNEKLLKSKNYPLVIDKLIECNPDSGKFSSYYVDFKIFMVNEKILNSSRINEVIDILYNYIFYERTIDVSTKAKTTNLLFNKTLKNENEFADIVLKATEFKIYTSLVGFISLCESYYEYVNNVEIDKSKKEIIKNKYEYLIKKYLPKKDNTSAVYYSKIFTNTNLLEIENYIEFVDKVFSIEDENKLQLLDKLLVNCVKNCNIGAFPMLETVDKIENSDILYLLNKIFSNPSLDKLKNSQLISLYISQIRDECLLYEFEKMLNNKTLINSSYFNEIMTNAITIRSFRALQELNNFITYLGHSQKPLDLICKLNYEDKLLDDILYEVNYITNLLSDVRVSLIVDKIESLLLELLSKKDYKFVLYSILALKQEIENNIKQNMVINNTLRTIEIVNEKEKTYQKILNNN